MPVSVTNLGNEPSQGFTVSMTASYGLGFDTRYAECVYTRIDGDHASFSRAECSFDQVLAPGDTVTLPEPLRLAVALTRWRSGWTSGSSRVAAPPTSRPRTTSGSLR
ncbi:hypothetical protein NKH18_28385 [Streptomyces sp. M10(2022)]